jgi:hypothetical protein
MVDSMWRRFEARRFVPPACTCLIDGLMASV